MGESVATQALTVNRAIYAEKVTLEGQQKDMQRPVGFNIEGLDPE